MPSAIVTTTMAENVECFSRLLTDIVLTSILWSFFTTLLQELRIGLGTVSTTCGSGWVMDQVHEPLANRAPFTSYPPATAGGTDCVQAWRLTLRQSFFICCMHL